MTTVGGYNEEVPKLPSLVPLDTQALPILRRSGQELDVPPAPVATSTQVPTVQPLLTRVGTQSAPVDPPPEQRASRQDVREIVCSYPWPQGCAYWIRIALCESSLSSDAIGHMDSYVGLFQVWLGHGYGHTWLLDPSNNVLAAWELSHGGEYTGAWPWCQYQ